jgi:hypothetical protein
MTRGVGFNPSSGAAFINCVLFAGHLPVFGYGRYYEEKSQRVAAIHRKRRITFSKGPTVLAILFFLASATKRNLEFRPAK